MARNVGDYDNYDVQFLGLKTNGNQSAKGSGSALVRRMYNKVAPIAKKHPRKTIAATLGVVALGTNVLFLYPATRVSEVRPGNCQLSDITDPVSAFVRTGKFLMFERAATPADVRECVRRQRTEAIEKDRSANRPDPERLRQLGLPADYLQRTAKPAP